jgi:hypothetical protein
LFIIACWRKIFALRRKAIWLYLIASSSKTKKNLDYQTIKWVAMESYYLGKQSDHSFHFEYHIVALT